MKQFAGSRSRLIGAVLLGIRPRRGWVQASSVTQARAAIPPLADGETLYGTYCQSCHGSEGKGDGTGVPDTMLKPRPFSAGVFKFDTDADWEKGTDADLANIIRNGTGAYGGSPLMPAWANLTDDEVGELVAYIRELQHR